MDVVCYAADPEGPGQRVTALLESVIPREHLLICQTIADLTHSLLQPTQGVRAAVLLAHDLDQLHGLLTLRSLLQDMRVILILPDRDASTVAQGHTLRPRLLTYVDVDFTPLVGAVLQKISAGLCPQDGCRSGEAQNKPGGLPQS
jgi:hypothetical protein